MIPYIELEFLRAVFGDRPPSHNAKPATRSPGEGCDGCKYFRRLCSSWIDYACHYCIDTGHLRNCEGGWSCPYYDPPTPEEK